MAEEEANSGGLDKLEWMYKGPGNLVDREEYLLGKAVSSSSTLVGVKSEVERDCLPTPLLSNNNSAAITGSLVNEQVDIARKIHEDPLLAIKKKEIERREQLLKNPVKMKKLQDMLKRQNAKQSRSVEGKKKMKKKQRKEDADSDSDCSDLDKALKNKYKKLKVKLGLDDLSNLSNDNCSVKNRKKQKNSKIVKNQDKATKSKKRLNKKISKKRSSSSNKHKKRHRKEITSSSSSNSESSSNSSSDSDNSSSSSSSSSSTSNSSRSSSESDSDSDEKSTKKVHNRKKKKRTTVESSSSKSNKVYNSKHNLKQDSTDSDTESYDCSRAEDGNRKYGLLLPPGKADSNAKKRAEETKLKRPANTATAKRDERETNNAKSKYVKTKPVRLSEAEKEERRREMMKNAEWRNDLRDKNVKKYKAKDERERKMEKEYSDDFYRNQLSYAASQGSVEGRIKSNINRIQRTASDMDRNFARR